MNQAKISSVNFICRAKKGREDEVLKAETGMLIKFEIVSFFRLYHDLRETLKLVEKEDFTGTSLMPG